MTSFQAQSTAQPQAISALTARVEDFLQSAGVDARATYHVALLIEELMTNLGTHGGVPGEQATILVTVHPNDVRVELRDRGPPFDPRSVPEPDLTSSIKDRQLGGLGLYLLRKLATEIEYMRRGEHNDTRFTVRRWS